MKIEDRVKQLEKTVNITSVVVIIIGIALIVNAVVDILQGIILWGLI